MFEVMSVVRRRNVRFRHFGFGEVFVSVISVEIHLFDFAHERISRVCAGALIVERLFRHRVEAVEEVGFVGNVIFDRGFDSDSRFEVVHGFDKVFEFFGVGVAAEA